MAKVIFPLLFRLRTLVPRYAQRQYSGHGVIDILSSANFLLKSCVNLTSMPSLAADASFSQPPTEKHAPNSTI